MEDVVRVIEPGGRRLNHTAREIQINVLTRP